MLTVKDLREACEGLPDCAVVQVSVDVVPAGFRPVMCTAYADAAVGVGGDGYGILVVEGCAELPDGSVTPWDDGPDSEETLPGDGWEECPVTQEEVRLS